MSQPISIIVTATGIRLDVLPDATVEMNMGGISLLSLADRTATYTNTFKLPRTPVNERAFGFASNPSRSNKVSLAVTISKGLFSRAATLKVESFDTDYQCTASFATSLELITGKTYEYLYDAQLLMAGETDINFVRAVCASETPSLLASYLVTSETTAGYPSIPTEGIKSKSLFVYLSELLSDIGIANGITIEGTIFDDPYFQTAWICLPNLYINREGTGPYNYFTSIEDSGNLITELIKEIAMIFFCDVDFTGTGININKVTLTGTPVAVDGFTFSKSTTSGLAKTNYITYDVCKSITNKYYGADMIAADGVGTKDIVKLKAYMPSSTGGLVRLFDDADATNKIIIGTSSLYLPSKSILYEGVVYGDSDLVGIPLSSFQMYNLSGYYSTLLDPIFLAPVILDATGWLDPITADNLMTSRLLLSRQLQGLYWVDSMAYDLTSGRTKMKLIKLPQ